MTVQSKTMIFDRADYFARHTIGNGLAEQADCDNSCESINDRDEPLRPLESRHDDGAEQGRGGRPHIEIPPGTSLEDLERAAVEKALQVHHGNRTHAAKTLGISVRTLQRKLKAWRIPALYLRHQPPSREYSNSCPG